jgi:hypothetical protein
MALVDCKECGAEVSDSALNCSKCGVQLRKPKRGVFGNIIKYSFVLFNLLMAWWLVAGMGAAGEAMGDAATSAEQAGAALGTGIGAMLIVTIWVFGDIILGLFVLLTRPNK